MDPAPLRNPPGTIWDALDEIRNEVTTLRHIVEEFYKHYETGKDQALDVAHSLARVYFKGE